MHDVDAFGAKFREAQDIKQLKIDLEEWNVLERVKGFKDFGLVELNGEYYFLSMYMYRGE